MHYYKTPITDETITDIVITAIEGGIGYWACLDNTGDKFNNDELCCSEIVAQILLDGGIVWIIDEEDESTHHLTLDKLLYGISLNAEHRPFDSDLSNIDSITADCIFQYALFGDVIYG